MFSFILLASIVAFGSCELTTKNCPYGLARDAYLLTFGTNCYRFELDNKKDHDDAGDDCVSVKGGSLAMPKTADVDGFLAKSLKEIYKVKSPVWIGLSDAEDENEFYWADNSFLNVTSDYKNFARFEGPRKSLLQSGFEDCVAYDIEEDIKWHDYHCTSEFLGLFNAKKYYICQYPMINVPTTPKPTCKPNVCDKNCGMNGYKTDAEGCRLCECDV